MHGPLALEAALLMSKGSRNSDLHVIPTIANLISIVLKGVFTNAFVHILGPTCSGVVSRPCSSNPCVNGAVCLAQPNGYQCVCAPGFSGSNCETDLRMCPCENGATCIVENGQYRCDCAAGFEGESIRNPQNVLFD